jgi:hypothetical protein
MQDSDHHTITYLEEVLRPLAREYANLPPDTQLSLSAVVPVKITYLRDAYLALAKLKRMKGIKSDRPSSL